MFAILNGNRPGQPSPTISSPDHTRLTRLWGIYQQKLSFSNILPAGPPTAHLHHSRPLAASLPGFPTACQYANRIWPAAATHRAPPARSSRARRLLLSVAWPQESSNRSSQATMTSRLKSHTKIRIMWSVVIEYSK